MENLINLLLFIGRFLLIMLLIGIPLLLIIIFIADKVYKRIEPKYEELRERKIKELKGKEKKEKT